jgi:phosphorylcholine metabolism protein LicD
MSISYTALNKNNNIALTLSASEGDVILTTATSHEFESCKKRKHKSEQERDGNKTHNGNLGGAISHFYTEFINTYFRSCAKNAA